MARKPPKSPEQRLARWSRSMAPGTLNGRVASATPLTVDVTRLAPRLRQQPQSTGGFDPNADPVVIGSGALADYADSVAIGARATNHGDHGIAIGYHAWVAADSGIAIGNTADAEGATSIAIGASTLAEGFGSTAIGHGAQATRDEQTMLGGDFTELRNGGGGCSQLVMSDTSSNRWLLTVTTSGTWNITAAP